MQLLVTAAMILLLSANIEKGVYSLQYPLTFRQRLTTSRCPASTTMLDFLENEGDGNSLRDAVSTVTTAYLDAMAAEESAELQQVSELAAKQKMVQARLFRSQKTTSARRVTLPLTMGLVLAQVNVGKQLAPKVLNVDNLTYESAVVDEEEMDWESVQSLLPADFRGVLVWSVQRDSPAWLAGIRPADVVLATSATLGDFVWRKWTLSSIESALSSRSMVADQVVLEVAPPASLATMAETTATAVDRNYYELSLTKPIGLVLSERDGQVVVTGLAAHVSKMVRYAVQVGDRVVAVQSSVGGAMWPVSTVEGVISACTSRLPGQSVQIRFERVSNVTAANVVEALAAPLPTVSTAVTALYDQSLLARCRDVLRRYSLGPTVQDAKEPAAVTTRFMGKYAVPAIVADKVVDALASARTALDCVTLSMLMNAYLSCNQPQDAIAVFEAAVGLRGDGSATPVVVSKYGQIRPRDEALNLYTATALLQAHAARRDVGSVLRVLAALEGRSGVVIMGQESAPWPWTGTFGSIQPDTQCFNIALAAVARSNVDQALAIFHSLSDPIKGEPSLTRRGLRAKDVVSYNSVLMALVVAERYEEAFALFDRMKRDRIRPDKFTYTTLLKACTKDGDVSELLYDMQEGGVEPDVVTYNTRIESLCRSRDWTKATKLVTEMESRGVQPNSRTYGLLMNAMLKANRPEACLTLFESACLSHRTTGLTNNVYLYTTAITAAASIGMYERALELLSRMSAKGIRPNVKTLTAVVGACLKGDKPDLAVKVYEKISQPDGHAMTQGIRAYCLDGNLQAAVKIVEEQKRHTRVMSGTDMMYSYRAIFQAACSQPDLLVASSLMWDMLSKGFIPDNDIIFAFSQGAIQGDEHYFRLLLNVTDQLHERNLPVEGSLYAATIGLGNRLGGTPRIISSLMAQKKHILEPGTRSLLRNQPENAEAITAPRRWQDFLQNEVDVSSTLIPSLTVRVSSRTIGRVMRAERNLTSKGKQQLSVAVTTSHNSHDSN
jgi:pentatricopeptide repeat protein